MSTGNTWFVVFLMFIHLLPPVSCGFDKVCTYETYQRGVHVQGACGERLPEILSLVCKRSTRVRQDKHIGKILSCPTRQAYVHVGKIRPCPTRQAYRCRHDPPLSDKTSI
jgi:hypothetical protein